MQLAGVIEALSGATSPEDVFELVCGAVAPLGYRWVGLFALTPEAAAAAGASSPIVIANFPGGFAEGYLRLGRHAVDPVLALAADTITALLWDDVVAGKSLSVEQRALDAERRAAGLHDEVTCPIHGAHGQRFALRFASGEPGPCDRSETGTLQILAIHVYYALTRIWAEAAKPAASSSESLADHGQAQIAGLCALSQREQEVMLWTARGKSASSISVILDLSENTVNFYVKNAMRKLGTTNRVVAVVLAVRSGLITP
jgi:LuxR family quorum-sensing system transcriptional regulator CciR